jgi:glycerol-3-phosphate dehydrogenase (NAD(P)+)
MAQIGILGAGSFGTAVAVHAARAGHRTTLWVRREEAATQMQAARENRSYLPGVGFPEGLAITHDLEALLESDPLVVAAPSHGYRGVLREFLAARSARPSGGAPGALTVVSATKGIEAETLARMSRVSAEECERAATALRFAAFSGPTFAAELARAAPSAAVVASEDMALAAELRETLASPTLRLYSSADVVGVELSGAAKNVIAIGAGVVSGLGLGTTRSPR